MVRESHVYIRVYILALCLYYANRLENIRKALQSNDNSLWFFILLMFHHLSCEKDYDCENLWFVRKERGCCLSTKNDGGESVLRKGNPHKIFFSLMELYKACLTMEQHNFSESMRICLSTMCFNSALGQQQLRFGQLHVSHDNRQPVGKNIFVSLVVVIISEESGLGI